MAAHHQRRWAALIHPHALAVCRGRRTDAPITAAHHYLAVRNLRHAQHFAGDQTLPSQFAIFVVSQYITLVAADEHQAIAAGHSAANDNTGLDAPHLLAGGTIQTHQTALAGSAINRIFA